jgi:hypothetical protein
LSADNGPPHPLGRFCRWGQQFNIESDARFALMAS